MPENQQNQDVFLTLYQVDMKDKISEKNTGKAVLKYLPWVDAWAAVRQRFPDATYKIYKDEHGLPYVYDPASGIMVYTTVTILGETHEMWLPVMDGANNAMKFEPYEITTKYGSKQVAAATMFDVNKTIMRCLVKNLAMFGLGMYVYAGEDMPEETEEAKAAKAKELTGLVEAVDKEVLRVTKGMEQKDKVAFAKSTIQPIINSLNYKTCTNIEQMRALLDKLKAMPAKKEE